MEKYGCGDTDTHCNTCDKDINENHNIFAHLGYEHDAVKEFVPSFIQDIIFEEWCNVVLDRVFTVMYNELFNRTCIFKEIIYYT